MSLSAILSLMSETVKNMELYFSHLLLLGSLQQFAEQVERLLRSGLVVLLQAEGLTLIQHDIIIHN